MDDTWLAGAGLAISFVGAVLIWIYGVPRYPSQADAGKGFLLLEETDEAEKATVKLASLLGKIGMFLLAFGFALQFAALFVGSSDQQSHRSGMTTTDWIAPVAGRCLGGLPQCAGECRLMQRVGLRRPSSGFR